MDANFNLVEHSNTIESSNLASSLCKLETATLKSWELDLQAVLLKRIASMIIGLCEMLFEKLCNYVR